MNSPKKPRRARSYIAGEKGLNRVRLYSHPRDKTLMLEWRDEAGRRCSRSLHHDDPAVGRQAADELAVALRRGENPQQGELTLKTLFDNYEREVTPTKTAAKQAHDKRARKLFEQCWGNAKVKDLDRRDWDRFIQQRRAGTLRCVGDSRKKKGVRERMIEYDLRFLMAVCNWAETVRVKGEPLLDRNPFRGFPLPTETNPRRPIVTPAEYDKLVEAAKQFGTEVSLYLLLNHDTGHRCTAVGRLRWEDVDLEEGLVVWRAEHDKPGREHTTPLTPGAVAALKAVEKDEGWIFASPTSPEQPIRRDLLRDWWQKLEAASKIERIPGRGWHSLRRKFATDLKAEPMADVQALGGWKDPNTILKCYMKSDVEAMQNALARRSERRAVA